MLFFVTVFVVALVGCGGTNVSATTTPCNLSMLKIKSVKIDGDREGFVSRAIRSELYKRGARVDENGVEVIGSVLWNNAGTPIEVSVEVVTMAFASTAIGGTPLVGPAIGSTTVARRIADDFCQCSAATADPLERPAKK